MTQAVKKVYDNGDADIDETDFGIFQRCLSGAGKPADPNCAD